MSTACPCCGQAVDTDLPIVDGRDVSFGGVTVRITKTHARIIQVLVDCYPRVASYGHILERIYDFGRNEPPGAADTLKVQMLKMRRHLEACSMPFQIETVWGEGLQLKLPEKQRRAA